MRIQRLAWPQIEPLHRKVGSTRLAHPMTANSEETPVPDVTIMDTTRMPYEEVRRGRVHMIRRKRLPLDTGIPA